MVASLKLMTPQQSLGLPGPNGRVEATDRTQLLLTAESRRLVLRPAWPGATSELMVVTQFPYLVGRDSRTAADAPLQFLSRQHACLVLRGGQPHVIDLASTNGTWVDGEKLLAHQQHLLRDGVAVAFGNRELAFTVHLEQGFAPARPATELTSSAPEQQPAPAAEPAQSPGTMYIQAGRPFLDALCEHKHGDSPEGAGPSGDRLQTSGQTGSSGGSSAPIPAGRLRRWRKAGIWVSELKEALSDDGAPRSRRVWLVPGLLGLILAVALGSYLHQAPEREIRALIAAGNHLESLHRANTYLQSHPDDTGAAALATEALARHLVPAWQGHLEQGRYSAARAEVAAAPEPSRSHAQGARLMRLLEWIADLDELVSRQGGPQAPIALFDHDIAMGALLQRWDQDAGAYQHLLVWTQNHVPSFESAHTQTMSHLRVLQNERSVHLDAIAKLKFTIDEKLARDQTSELGHIVQTFGLTYPRIRGLERLQSDLDALLAIRRALAEKDLAELSGAHDYPFQTPLFAEHGRTWLAAHLPPRELLDAYDLARQHWLAGRADQAIGLLAGSQDPLWRGFTDDQLARFRAVADAYDALRSGDPEAHSRDLVLGFHRSLDPKEDGYFLQSVQDQVEGHRNGAVAEARQLFEQAREIWGSYRSAGGISGLMRLEPALSKTFQERSQQISEALGFADQAGRLYVLLDLEPSAGDQALYLEVVTEASRQHQWLLDLHLVLDPSLLEQKLQLLPPIQERTS